MKDKPTVIYIIADRRSGSTLLENILSKSPETVSVGELAMLKGHLHKLGPGELWNWNCSCGKPITECEFWSKILTKMQRTDFETKISWPYKSVKIFLASFAPRLACETLVKYVHTEKNSEARQSLDDIYKAVGEVSSKNFIVDSSKDPMQALAIRECKNADAKFIWLVRDLRAITYSKLKRWKVNKRSDKNASETLLDSFLYKKICRTALHCVGANNSIVVSYEKLAADPQAELNRICTKFGMELYPAPVYMELSNDHSIAGTPGRFERRSIAADDSWKEFYENKNALNTLGRIFNSL